MSVRVRERDGTSGLVCIDSIHCAALVFQINLRCGAGWSYVVVAWGVWFSTLIFQIDLRCGAYWGCVVHVWGRILCPLGRSRL